jgi:hypothetical protein
LPEKQLGLHFIPQPGCRYLSASVVFGAAAEAPGIEQWFVEWMLDDPLQKRIPFSTSRIEGMASGCIPPPKPRTASSRSMTPRLSNPPVSARR